MVIATVSNLSHEPCVGDVTYIAGKQIHLLPGFKVINGAKFHGYIEPVNVCLPKDGNLEIAVLHYPPEDEYSSQYISNFNYEKNFFDNTNEIYENNVEKKVNRENEIFFKVFPNPATNYINLNSSYDGLVLIEFLDLLGNVIYHQYTSSKSTINVTNLTRGVYIIKSIYGEQNVFVQKIVLQ